MSTGYSGTPLIKKLGIKEGMRMLLINEPIYYFELLGELPVGTTQLTAASQADFIHFFTQDKTDLLSTMPQLKAALPKNGMIWVSWPKKSSKVETDVSDAIVRDAGLSAGLVDVKVCAVDEVWSALKFVYRVIDR
jgi:hypothetical protein